MVPVMGVMEVEVEMVVMGAIRNATADYLPVCRRRACGLRRMDTRPYLPSDAQRYIAEERLIGH